MPQVISWSWSLSLLSLNASTDIEDTIIKLPCNYFYALHILFLYAFAFFLLCATNFRRNYYACPDDDTFRFMASIYSHSHHNMSLSKEFPGGITNGAFWYGKFKTVSFAQELHVLQEYISFPSLLFSFICCSTTILTKTRCRYPIYGGMQDWNYIHAGCFELTLEISDNKWPNANEVRFCFPSCIRVYLSEHHPCPPTFLHSLPSYSHPILNLSCHVPGQIPTLWEYNKMSLLNLAASLVKVHCSVAIDFLPCINMLVFFSCFL